MADIANHEIRGRFSNGNAQEEAYRVQRSKKSGIYFAVSTTIANSTTDGDITALSGAGAAFTTLDGAQANYMEIFTDQAITIKFKTVQNPAAAGSLLAIKLHANTLRVIDYIADITAIFVTNASGSTANIDFVLI